MSLSRVQACEGFCVSISMCMMGYRLVFMPMKTFTQSTLSLSLSLLPLLFQSFFPVTAFLYLYFVLPCSSPPLLPFLSLPPILTSNAHPLPLLPVNTVIAWGTFQCVTDLSPLVLFMALSLFKFNQASMEPPAPFQFTTWTQQDGKSYANIKV